MYAVLCDNSLTPLLLWACLQRFHPAATREAARKMITDENIWQVREAIMELFGFDEKKGNDAGQMNQADPASTSTPSAKPSENADSEQPTSTL
jgi:hypothetical protein